MNYKEKFNAFIAFLNNHDALRAMSCEMIAQYMKAFLQMGVGLFKYDHRMSYDEDMRICESLTRMLTKTDVFKHFSRSLQRDAISEGNSFTTPLTPNIYFIKIFLNSWIFPRDYFIVHCALQYLSYICQNESESAQPVDDIVEHIPDAHLAHYIDEFNPSTFLSQGNRHTWERVFRIAKEKNQIFRQMFNPPSISSRKCDLLIEFTFAQGEHFAQEVLGHENVQRNILSTDPHLLMRITQRGIRLDKLSYFWNDSFSKKNPEIMRMFVEKGMKLSHECFLLSIFAFEDPSPFALIELSCDFMQKEFGTIDYSIGYAYRSPLYNAFKNLRIPQICSSKHTFRVIDLLLARGANPFVWIKPRKPLKVIAKPAIHILRKAVQCLSIDAKDPKQSKKSKKRISLVELAQAFSKITRHTIEPLARAFHPRLGSESPVGMIDAYTIMHIAEIFKEDMRYGGD